MEIIIWTKYHCISSYAVCNKCRPMLLYRWWVAAVIGNRPLKFRRPRTCLAVPTAKMFRLFFKVLITIVAQ